MICPRRMASSELVAGLKVYKTSARLPKCSDGFQTVFAVAGFIWLISFKIRYGPARSMAKRARAGQLDAVCGLLAAPCVKPSFTAADHKSSIEGLLREIPEKSGR